MLYGYYTDALWTLKEICNSHRRTGAQVEGQAMILGEEGWPIATAKGMQVRRVTDFYHPSDIIDCDWE